MLPFKSLYIPMYLYFLLLLESDAVVPLVTIWTLRVCTCAAKITVFLKLDWSTCTGERKRVPEFVFLAHGVDVMSVMHAPFVFRSFGSIPYTMRFFLLPMWPVTFMVMLGMWIRSKTFLFTFYALRNHLCQTWAVPRLGFHVMPFSFVSVHFCPWKQRKQSVLLYFFFLLAVLLTVC